MSHHIHNKSGSAEIAQHFGPVSVPLDPYATHYLTGERHVEQDFSERGMLKRLFDPAPSPRWPLWLPLAFLAALAAYAIWSLAS